MITVGLDFGTHQSKICIEYKEGAELSYEFFKFKDANNESKYTLPSIIQIDKNEKLMYGYIPNGRNGEIIRYFKQAAFTSIETGLSQMDAIYYSIWYIAYILFDLQEKYGQEFAIQMGVPSDGMRLNKQKMLAVRILLSAYRLVEEVFESDKKSFLIMTEKELKTVTELVPYNREKKDEYSILVFPEAYACLMPLVKSEKIAQGMSLMIDIGGGTTDISFFTIMDKQPRIYDFYSIDKGLNFLTDASRLKTDRITSNINLCDIKLKRIDIFNYFIYQTHDTLKKRLTDCFEKSTILSVNKLFDALKNRPLIYSGGGSTFKQLRTPCCGFNDIIHISGEQWNMKCVVDSDKIQEEGLCPILSTAYGLSVSVIDDNIICEPFDNLFAGLKDCEIDDRYTPKSNSMKKKYHHDNNYDSFNYMDDYDAWK